MISFNYFSTTTGTSSGSSKSKAEAEKEVDLIIECFCHDFFGQIIRGVEGGYLVKGMPMRAVECVIGSRNRVKEAEWPDGTALYEIQGDSEFGDGRFQLVYYTLWFKDGMLRDWTKHYRTP
jgi:hypothetical protein